MTSPLEQKKIKIAGPVDRDRQPHLGRRRDLPHRRPGWSPNSATRPSFAPATTRARLLAESVADDLGAIGAYIAPVEIDDGGRIEPGNLREQIRRSGVTIGLPVQV